MCEFGATDIQIRATDINDVIYIYTINDGMYVTFKVEPSVSMLAKYKLWECHKGGFPEVKNLIVK